MAVGMAGFAIFTITAGIKFNADKFHHNGERIHAIIEVVKSEDGSKTHQAKNPYPLLPAILNEFPQVSAGIRIQRAGRLILSQKDKKFYENHAFYVDDNFLEFFSFEIISGNPKTALSDPKSIVLTETSAYKYFGDSNPIGRTITVNQNEDLVVTAILSNLPRTSSLRFDFLIPIRQAYRTVPAQTDWNKASATTFILLGENIRSEHLTEKFTALIDKYYPVENNPIDNLYLFPLLDFRLKSEHIESFINSSNITATYIIITIGIILLAVVCINFINLSIARFMYRQKEIAIRKISGATRWQLLIQFLSESVLLAFLALPIAIILFEIIYPVFINFIGAPSFESFHSQAVFSITTYPFVIKYMVFTSTLVGILSGLYPALVLSANQPVSLLQGGRSGSYKKHRGSKIMIITQFTISIVFIGFAEVIDQQNDHIIKGDFGFDRSNVASIDVANMDIAQRHVLENEIKNIPEIILVASSKKLPVFWFSEDESVSTGLAEKIPYTLNTFSVGYNFPEVLGINIIRGNSFSRASGTERDLIVNQALVNKLEWDNPIGQTLNFKGRTGIVTGVSEDFLFGDIGFEIPPSILYLEPNDQNVLLLKFSPLISFWELHERVQERWLEVVPGMPFNFLLLQNYFKDTIMFIDRMILFLKAIGIVAIFFSCMGLLGLAAYMVERRTKEIGIRKVLGASIPRISWLILKDYITLVIIANIIGITILYFSWNAILQTGLLFMKQIHPTTYISIFIITLIIAIIAVLSQIMKVALKNPIESLRYE